MTAPSFGEWVEEIRWASPENPHKRGMFVRAGHTPHGRMNPGPWWELTDGQGNFWRFSPENCAPMGVCPAGGDHKWGVFEVVSAMPR